MTRTFGIRNRRIAQDCPRYRGYHCCTLPLPPYRLPFSWTALAVCLGGFPDEQSRGHLGPDMMPSLCWWDAIQGSGSAPYKVSSFNKIYPHTLLCHRLEHYFAPTFWHCSMTWCTFSLTHLILYKTLWKRPCDPVICSFSSSCLHFKALFCLFSHFLARSHFELNAGGSD